jgi:hypothetical protein
VTSSAALADFSASEKFFSLLCRRAELLLRVKRREERVDEVSAGAEVRSGSSLRYRRPFSYLSRARGRSLDLKAVLPNVLRSVTILTVSAALGGVALSSGKSLDRKERLMLIILFI